jgi:HK97 family phage major capsid protein
MAKPGWVLSPRTAAALRSLRNATSSVRIFPEMLKGELKGFPFAVSDNQTISATGTTEILLADFGEVVIAEYGLILDTASAGGMYTDAQSNVIQVFQADQTLIRVASMADIGVRHQSAVAVVTGVTY